MTEGKKEDEKKKPKVAGELDPHPEHETPQAEGVDVEPEAHAHDPQASPKEELLYLKAEFENFRKRTNREKQQAIQFANERFVTELLSIVDLFDRALSAVPPLEEKMSDSEHRTDVDNFITGIRMTQQEMFQVLGRFGVEFIGAAGEKFDPERHEAISQQETTDDKAGTVLTVFQKGCTMNGRLLKPAKVVVGVAGEKPAETE